MIKFFKRKIDIDQVFSLDYQFQKDFLDSFSEPINEFQRSFFQYKCQVIEYNQIKKICLNFCSCLIFPIIVFFSIFNRLFNNSKTIYKEAIFPYKGKYGAIIPNSYFNKYTIHEIYYQKGLKNSFLSLFDLKFLLILFKKYPLNPYFVCSVTYKLSFYSYINKMFSPKAIFSSCEYSFSSSILTKYCNINSIEHINVMHGEKIFSITDSFVKFDKFIVWDNNYKDLFISLRADSRQFEVIKPDVLNLKLNHSKIKIFDFTYYLGGEKEYQLLKINTLLEYLISIGFKVNLRYHPRYSNVEEIRCIFKNIHIEDAKKVSLATSFENTETLIALYSTVLYQGLINEKNVLIDDVTCDKVFLDKLRDLKYNVFYENVKWISEEFPEIGL